MQYSADDILLLELFNKGSEDAVKEIYLLFYKSLCYFLKEITGNSEDAEDIAVDSFLKLWEKNRRFESIHGIRSFLYITAKNLALNLLRQKKTHERNHRQILYLSGGGNELISIEETESEILRILYSEIDTLPPQCKTIFRLLSFEGYNTSQVAEKLGICEQTVRNQKTKAFNILRTAFLKRNLTIEMAFFSLLLLRMGE